MYKYVNYIVLFESKRIENLRNKYVGKLGLEPTVFDYFAEHKNLLEVALKIYFKTPKEKIKEIEQKGTKFHKLLIDMLIKFMDNKDNIRSVKSIAEIKDLDHLNKILNELVDYDKYDKYGNDLWVLLNSYEYFIYKPYTFLTSNMYGNRKERENNWCTTYDEEYFSENLGEKGGLLYVINKLDPTKDFALNFKLDKQIYVWSYKNENIYINNNLEKLIKDLWDSYEEPYMVLMENLDKLLEDIPNIKYEELLDDAKYKLLNISVKDFVDIFGIDDLLKYLDEDKYMEDLKNTMYNDYLIEWKYHITVDQFIEIIDDIYKERSSEIIKYFTDKMKQKNEEKGEEYYDTNDVYINDIEIFIYDNYTDDNIIDLIKDLSLEKEAAKYLTEINLPYSPVDHIERYYGDIYSIDPNKLDVFISDYIDWKKIANDIPKNMTVEELYNFVYKEH